MTGCGAFRKNNIFLLGSEGIPDNEFKGIDPVFADSGTVGGLTSAYISNTESLIIVNGRLKTLCLAHEITECGNSPR